MSKLEELAQEIAIIRSALQMALPEYLLRAEVEA
jgi:hypothetical protein